MIERATDSAMHALGIGCHVCGALTVELVPGYGRFRRVTSDCIPWPAGGQLLVCRECGCIQKPIDKLWEAEVAEIYASYNIYHQGGGTEQSVFDHDSGQRSPRSQRILRRLQAEVSLPTTGRLLDVGCGNGAFLRAFSRHYPGWTLVGTELNDKYRSQVEDIPGVEGLFVVPAGNAPGKFSLVSMVHLLEHVPSPRPFLAQIRNKMEPEALLVIEVPDFLQNPFDLMIVDHCTHFTAATLRALVSDAGYEPLVCATDWVPKELSLVARRAESQDARCIEAPDISGHRVLKSHLRWLEQIVLAARRLAGRGSLGLFGTSIAATWLWGDLNGEVQFFVDEDPHRAGTQYMGCPVCTPTQVPNSSDVFIALPPNVARGIAARLAGRGGSVHFLPELQADASNETRQRPCGR